MAPGRGERSATSSDGRGPWQRSGAKEAADAKLLGDITVGESLGTWLRPQTR